MVLTNMLLLTLKQNNVFLFSEIIKNINEKVKPLKQ